MGDGMGDLVTPHVVRLYRNSLYVWSVVCRAIKRPALSAMMCLSGYGCGRLIFAHGVEV